MSLGPHTGGGLWTLDKGELNCYERWQKFDGKRDHATQPFVGKFYLTIHTTLRPSLVGE